jgi:predicted nucleotidyltransferase component of viral defense system
MDRVYADTVRLLLKVAPYAFDSEIFAMKGGTALNLFLHDMPRLSVDIDVVYLPWEVPREDALNDIAEELDRIAQKLDGLGFRTRKIATDGLGDSKLLVETDVDLVKIEVNTVFRGSVMPIERRPLSPKTSELFAVELDVPTLAPAELYGGKMVAALDRQHPRDLFDVWKMFTSSGLNEEMVECFVVYLAGHNRPTHEVLFAKDKDIAGQFRDQFVGMTREPVELDVLLDARRHLKEELPRHLTERHRAFLTGLARAEPDWGLLDCEHAARLPALRWKLKNLETFRDRRPDDFKRQAVLLSKQLGVS